MRRTTHKTMASILFALLPLFMAPLTSLHARAAAQDTEAMDAPEAPPAGRVEYAYGGDPLQKLDFWHATGSKPAALIVFVHGGGWKRGDKNNATGMTKVDHFLHEGYAVASINYRLVPAATVEQQAADVVAAVAWARANAARLGVDTSRVVLIGHSAGAHLVALVGTAPQYLSAAGLAMSDIRGVIALDGASYEVPRQIAEAGRFMRATYVGAFGTDLARQKALSPIFQAAAPNVAAFLILHVDRADGKTQSEALAAALVKAGTAAEVRGFDGTGLRGHMEINRSLGSADYPATAVVDTWLRTLLRQQ